MSAIRVKLLYRPHIPKLNEQNVRTGSFEGEPFASVLKHLPAEVRPVIEFAYLTGWRIVSEVLPLEWRRVDFTAGEVTLDPHTTKMARPGRSRWTPHSGDSSKCRRASTTV